MAMQLRSILSFLVCWPVLACNSQASKSSGSVTRQNAAKLFTRYQMNKIILPPGFSIAVYAQVDNARSMCRGERTLFVGNRTGDKVYAVQDNDNDGFAEKVWVVDAGLDQPNGVAFRNGSLYVAEVSRILRYDDIENRLANPPRPVVVYDKYPTDAHHGWKFIAFGPDGMLYVPVGAPCNVCEKKDPIYASITRINPDGTGMSIYARGIRNTVGFAWHPQTGALWFTDNGRDNMGNDMPADELNCAPSPGMHFGFPYCHQGDTPDPGFGKDSACNAFTAPAQKLGPHVAALGMRFYTGKQFLPEYQNQAFIAEHGSWNRETPLGYRVMLCRIADNKVVQYIPFAHGWLQPDGTVLGRPVDIEWHKDGSMLISDDKNGLIYRVRFNP